MSTEPTVLIPLVHNPSPPSLSEGAIGEGGQLPEREEIVLKPCEGFPRALSIEWQPHGVSVKVCAPTLEWLTWTSAHNADVSLVAHEPSPSRPDIYCLRAAGTSFRVSSEEFELLAAKLAPRGVRVVRP